MMVCVLLTTQMCRTYVIGNIKVTVKKCLKQRLILFNNYIKRITCDQRQMLTKNDQIAKQVGKGL